MTYFAEICGNTYRPNVLHSSRRGKHLDHTNPMFYKMHALKSFDLINLKTAVVMYKAYNNMLPVNLQNLFVHFVAIRKTRHVNM